MEFTDANSSCNWIRMLYRANRASVGESEDVTNQTQHFSLRHIVSLMVKAGIAEKQNS
jgi:hypothetical protein